MDEEGEVDGKFPKNDNLLAFLGRKINTCPCENLTNAIKSFDKHTDVVKARDLLYRRVSDSAERRIKHRKAEEIFKGLYDLMQISHRKIIQPLLLSILIIFRLLI